jgi:Tol biopolymer transport system component
LWTTSPDGSNERYLTTALVSHAHPFEPTWSPDGTAIAVVVDEEQSIGDERESFFSNVYLVEVERGVTRQLTNIAGERVLDPVWSPDGTTIVSVATEGEESYSYALWFTGADSSDSVRLPGEYVPLIKTDVSNPSITWIPNTF